VTAAPSLKAPAIPVELPKPRAPSVQTPPAQAPAFKPAFAANGAYVVQIAAPSSEASALAEWDRRAKALPEFFASAERYVVQADVNGKTVYRLRAGPFAAKADADAFCAAYKATGGNCFPAAK
jgi:cell division septation protein DedD